jgi:putative PIN family toxin of toxin-antitoxin system
MVFLQAAVSRRGPAFALLTFAEAGRLELLVSREILSEVREVLFRPTVQRKFPLLTSELIQAFLARLATFTILVEHVPNVIRLSRDPDDEAYLNLALAGQAQYLVTRDHDLLDLAAGDLLRTHPELKVIDPAAFLKELAREPE